MGKNLILGTKKYLLLLGDAIILYFSLWLTLIIRYRENYNTDLWANHLWPFSLVFIIWLIIFYIDELYELDYRRGKASLLSRFIRSLVFGGIFAIIFFYLGQDRLFTIRPQRVLFINLLLFGLFSYFWRLLLNFFSRSTKNANGLMIVGYNHLVREIAQEIKQRPELGFQLRVIVSETDANIIPDELKKFVVTNHFQDLKKICLEKKVNIIISTIHPRENPELSKSLFNCLPLKISFFDIATFYEKITGKIPVTTIEQIWFLENLTESNKKSYEILKRILDIFFSLILLLLSLPFIPLIILAVKLDSRGPIFFNQIRTGREGKPFRAIKFRTMVANAEMNGPQWATENDPRVTKLGRLLRKTRIDEIPQLINVLRGEMSLIGPRPERPEFVEQLQTEIPFYKERLLIKPGLTGWAQVMGPAYGGSKEESLEKLQFDLFYIKNRSLALDLSILLKTIRTVLSQQGH